MQLKNYKPSWIDIDSGKQAFLPLPGICPIVTHDNLFHKVTQLVFDATDSLLWMCTEYEVDGAIIPTHLKPQEAELMRLGYCDELELNAILTKINI